MTESVIIVLVFVLGIATCATREREQKACEARGGHMVEVPWHLAARMCVTSDGRILE